MVFQDYALWPHLAARDNVAFALRRNGIGRSARRAEADATLDLVGLRGLEHRYPGELSGGEQQRVALARALIAGTGLILCDEPLSNLDADLRERMRVEISMRVRASGATTVYITHDQAEAFALADLLGVLEKGRLVQLGTPEQVYTQPATPFVARFTGLAGELPARLRGERSDGAVAVEPTGLTFARPLHVHLQEQHPGSGDAILAIRPAAIRLCAPDSDERHLVGTVADVAFRDRAYEHAVELDDGSKITGIHHPRRAQRGETVGLQLDPEGCLIFPRAHTGQP
jgi:iron(III) transport system ATP-binding protein